MHDQRLGTAEWSDPYEFSRQHAFKEGMFWLGRSTENGQPLGYSDDRHVCLVSGTRSGKGTSVIIPNLCLWPGSVVVVDPKGENATVTAARRGSGNDQCEGMGQRVHVLDPFEVAKVDSSYRSRFNPLDALDPNDPATLDEAGRLADAIVIQNPQSNDPFWDQSARALVKGLILHVLTDSMFEGRRNLLTVRELIARGDHEGVRILREELGEANPVSAQALLWRGVSQNNALGGKIAAVGENMASMIINSSKQYESVLQVANRNTEFLDSPGMESVLCASDFNLSDLKTDANGVSLYLSLPQRYMGEHYRWLRMMISLIITEMEAVPGQPASGHRVLMCLDEFAGLKKMEVIESAVAQIAGYGIKLFFALQSLEQFKSVYQDNWETFLSNAGLKIFFGLEDNFSREYVSKLAGETELLRELESSNQSEGYSTSESTGTQSSKSKSRSESAKGLPFFLRDSGVFLSRLVGKSGAQNSTNWSSGEQQGSTRGTNHTKSTGRSQSIYKRPLVNVDEIGRYFRRLDVKEEPNYPGIAMLMIAGSNPAVCRRSNYFEDQLLEGKFTPHPDHPTEHGSWKRFDHAHLFKLGLPPRSYLKHWKLEDEAEILRRVHLTMEASPGELVEKGDRVGFFCTFCGEFDDAPIYAPVSGVVRSSYKPHHQQGPEPEEGVVLVIETDTPVYGNHEHTAFAYSKIRTTGKLMVAHGCGCLGFSVVVLIGIVIAALNYIF